MDAARYRQAMDELTRTERTATIDALDRLVDQLAACAAWLNGRGEEQAEILLESAWRDVNACCNVLEKRPRRYPAGWLGSTPQLSELYGQNGQQSA